MCTYKSGNVYFLAEYKYIKEKKEKELRFKKAKEKMLKAAKKLDW